jgi:FkbM family methyltransferase
MDELDPSRRHRGWLEEAEPAFVVQYLRPGMTAVDVGAYMGVYSCLMGKLVGPEGRVHAFEPSPTSFQRLLGNLELNGLTNVVANRQAVSDRSGTLALHCYPPPFESLNSVVHRELARGGTALGRVADEPVQAVSLDEYADRSALARIDFLRLDAEGAEVEILHGARRLIMREAVRCLLVNVSDDRQRVMELLAAHGFRFFTPARGGALEPAAPATAGAPTNLVALR